MRFSRCFLLLVALLAPASALAVPDCYTSASLPAHLFPFANPREITEVTALTDDGNECVKVPFLNGEPVMRRKMNAPMRQLYESYAKAVESRNGAAARKLFAYVRPTTRTFPQWLWLYNEPQSAPMPWGTEMMAKIIRLLAPKTYDINYLIKYDKNHLPIVNLYRSWPVLFLLMGGELMPSEEWASCNTGGYEVQRLYSWRYPFLSLDSRENEGHKSNPSHKYELRLR